MLSQPLIHLPRVHILASPLEVGQAAASQIAAELRQRLAAGCTVRMIFAAAPSQSAMLHTLAKAEDIDWRRVEAFHMDEYIGLGPEAPQRFGSWLTREFFRDLPLGKVHLLTPEPDPLAAATSYAACLASASIDIVCLGIGMNGHLAFNDPPADFDEPRDVRVVPLAIESRLQQVREGLFRSLDDVPASALTLSIPRLLRAEKLFCCVSGLLKTEAVTRTFLGEISPLCPASILREHVGCSVFLDSEAAASLLPGDREP